MKASDFNIFACQFTAFTPGGSFRLWPLTKELHDAFVEHFPSDPISLPIPDNAPREIPRLILRNENETSKLQIAPARVDIMFNSGNPFETLKLSSKIQLSLDILELYEKTAGLSFGRLSFVITRSFTIENPAHQLAKHFCKSEWISSKALNRPQVLEMHAYKRYKVNDDFPAINSWIRHKAGELNILGSQKFTGLIVEQDLNTPQEETDFAKFEAQKRSDFYHAMHPEAERILTDYYPEVDNG